MSSHILTEVDRLATRIGIIHKGKLIEELDAGQLDQISARFLVIKTRNMNAAFNVLKDAGYSISTEPGDSIRLKDARAVDAPDEVAQALVHAGASPTYLAVEQENLEDHFLRLTAEKSE